MTSLSEKALTVRLANITANNEIHDAIFKKTVEYALRADALALLEQDIIAKAEGSLLPSVSSSIIIDLTRISQLGPFELCRGAWTISFPFRDIMLDMTISEFYREHPYIRSALSLLREFCGSAAQIDRPYISKTADKTYCIMIGIHISLPRQIT
jgi:hypothetical protein